MNWCWLGIHKLEPLKTSPIGSKICVNCNKIVMPKWARDADRKVKFKRLFLWNKEKDYCELAFGK